MNMQIFIAFLTSAVGYAVHTLAGEDATLVILVFGAVYGIVCDILGLNPIGPD